MSQLPDTQALDEYLLEVVRALHDHFAEGVPLYAMSFSSPYWRGKASATKAMVANLSGQTLTLSIDGAAPLTFAPYQFSLVSRLL